MSMRTVEIGVGAFLVAGILALVVLAFRVSGVSIASQGETYRLQAYFTDIGGLTVRSKVTLAGVAIGRVSAIDVDVAQGQARVTMEIDSSVDALPIDTGARILTEGILGGKYIGLEPGAEEDVLTDLDVIEQTQSAIVLENLIGEFIKRIGN